MSQLSRALWRRMTNVTCDARLKIARAVPLPHFPRPRPHVAGVFVICGCVWTSNTNRKWYAWMRCIRGSTTPEFYFETIFPRNHRASSGARWRCFWGEWVDARLASVWPATVATWTFTLSRPQKYLETISFLDRESFAANMYSPAQVWYINYTERCPFTLCVPAWRIILPLFHLHFPLKF